jgi:hypothetical protein
MTRTGGRKARVYTLVNLFSLGAGEPADQCFVSHYKGKEDAVRAFTGILRSRHEEPAQGGGALFDELLSGGHGYRAFSGSDEDWYFVRHEQVHRSQA